MIVRPKNPRSIRFASFVQQELDRPIEFTQRPRHVSIDMNRSSSRPQRHAPAESLIGVSDRLQPFPPRSAPRPQELRRRRTDQLPRRVFAVLRATRVVWAALKLAILRSVRFPS